MISAAIHDHASVQQALLRTQQLLALLRRLCLLEFSGNSRLPSSSV